MGLGNEVRGLHGVFLGSPTLRQIVLPAVAAAGTGLALGGAGNSPAWSAWADVGVAGEVLLPSLIVAVVPDTQSAACIATIEIGSCLSLGVNYAAAANVTAAGAAAIAGAARMQVRCQLIAVAAGQGYVIALYGGVFIPAGVGVIARWQTEAGAQTMNLSVIALQGWV